MMQSAPLKPAAAQRAKPETSQPAAQQQPPAPAPEAAPPEAPAPAVQSAAAALANITAYSEASAPPPAAGMPRAEALDPTIRVADNAMFVLDLSAETVDRVHELPVGGAIRKFTFKPRVPTPLDPAIAVRFLKNDGFILTDRAGNPMEWSATPRQPYEMGAGEQISLGPNEVIASYDELTSGALKKRALQLGASEAAMEAERDTLISFIKQETLKRRRQRTNQHSAGDDDLDLEEFVPDAAMLADSGPAYTL